MVKSTAGIVLLCGLLLACKNGETEKEQPGKGASSQGVTALFKEAKLPYQLSDTGLFKKSDTTSISQSIIAPLINDSIKNGYFGKKPVTYTQLAKLSQKEKETYLVVKAATQNKNAALLIVFDNKNDFAASYPFLLPDANPATSQVTAIDKKFTITKTTMLRSGSDIIGEGKEVIAYDPTTKAFSLIMMDALNDNPGILVNPIDTFPQTNKLAGDYIINKKNMVAVRDGRYANQLLVFIHTENEAGDCIGQMKGEFLLATSSMATYRQGGDPCVLNMTFKGNTVSISEEKGCGNYRGLDCPLAGTFTRKKMQAAKQPSLKPKRK